MKLHAVTSGPTGFHQRTFACVSCEYLEKMAIATDLKKSGGVAWLLNEPDFAR
jgi:hypothetical protein